MKIIPQPKTVYLKIESNKAGVLDTSSRVSAVEIAEVLDVGEGVSSIKKGDKVFVKSWAIDIIDYEDKKYHFVNVDTNGILAVVK